MAAKSGSGFYERNMNMSEYGELKSKYEIAQQEIADLEARLALLEWRSVEGCKPKHKQEVICTDGVIIAHCEMLLDGNFYLEFNQEPFYEVTHWMPLPAQPTSEEGVGK